MAKAKAWKSGAPGEPAFPAEFEIVRKAVLQVTDIKTNRNKYYAVELHCGLHGGSRKYRVYTHYGRTDDLERDPDSGQKESRYLDSLESAESAYQAIYRQKTSAAKGYKEVSLAASKIGSAKARGTSSGDVDEKTIQKLAENQREEARRPPQASQLPAAIQQLVRYLYDEATSALTATVNAKITANGIETPLGILTVGQIEKGEEILSGLYKVFQQEQIRQRQAAQRAARLEELSSDFYTVIPHRIGRTRAAAAAAVINSLEAIQQKQDTLQLMKDMLQVNGDGNVLFDARVDDEYRALGCELAPLDSGPERDELSEYILRSQIKSQTIKIAELYRVRRPDEHARFAREIGNQRLLFHGSRIQNWVGILTRGILMPKIVSSMGVNRTDAGWLGNGMYFGDAACTSVFYTTPGRKKTRLMALATVALGKQKRFTKITYGLEQPPAGFDSCHGVRRQPDAPSEFDDDEYVVYRAPQQRLDYLCEFTA